nr:discoidin domain-containing protein [uncultured Bacteroides sp.]
MNKNNVMNVTKALLMLLIMSFSITGCDDEDKDIIVPDNWVTLSGEELPTLSWEGGEVRKDYILADGLDASVVYVVGEVTWASAQIQYDKELGRNIILIKAEKSESVQERETTFTLCYDEKHQVKFSIKQEDAPPTLVTNILTLDMPASIRMNETLNLNETTSVLPENASYKTLKFTVAKGSEDKIQISDDGILSCIGGGTATIDITTTDGSEITAQASIEIINEVIFNPINEKWTVDTSVTYMKDGKKTNYVPDNTSGKPEHLFDDNTATFLSLPKINAANKKVATWKNDEIYFIIDMKTQQEFNFFVLKHRTGGGSSVLYLQKAKIYGSNDNVQFTQIGNEITIKSGTNNLAETGKYRYVKVQYTGYTTTSGNTVQIGEFNLGLNYANKK